MVRKKFPVSSRKRSQVAQPPNVSGAPYESYMKHHMKHGRSRTQFLVPVVASLLINVDKVYHAKLHISLCRFCKVHRRYTVRKVEADAYISKWLRYLYSRTNDSNMTDRRRRCQS